jgi:ABC-type cobalamin/Fe3+-siderophores transport system ATPase subunit
MRTLAVDDLAHRSFLRPPAAASGSASCWPALVACKPDILVLDEPTEGLDVRSRKIS